jgi:TRAP-type C4-dicarboxylate transport system permease small subunit
MIARSYRMAIWLGGLALLAAAMIDTCAVAARNANMGFHGSIELIQAAVLIAGAIGLVVAVGSRTYARVHLLTERVSAGGKIWMERVATLMVATFFLCILGGSAWIAADLWGGQELSEVMGVPWRWMRLFANLCFVIAILIAMRQLWAPRR